MNNNGALPDIFWMIAEAAQGAKYSTPASTDFFTDAALAPEPNGLSMAKMSSLRSSLSVARTAIWGGSVKLRHAMHMIRLLIAGEGLVRTGVLVLDATEHRERLLRVRDGAEPWEAVLAWKAELTAQMEESYRATVLPEEPDAAAADAFLIKVRAEMARREVQGG